MNSFTFVAVALALVIAVSAQAENLPHNDFFDVTKKCVPNERFINKCNSCGCNPDGNEAACTRMACQTPEKPRIDDFHTKGLICPSGERFYDKCNSCKCAADGHSAACTYMACPDFQ